MTSLGPEPLTVGHFDANGAVVDGDVVVKAFINLGIAPMDKIFLPATNGSTPIFVTPQVPAPPAFAIVRASLFRRIFSVSSQNFLLGLRQLEAKVHSSMA